MGVIHTSHKGSNMIRKQYKGFCLYIRTGEGFSAPARAITQQIEKRDVVVEEQDFLKVLGAHRLDRFWKGLWIFALRHPSFLKLNYRISGPLLLTIYWHLHNMMLKKKLECWIEKNKPDFIITTHYVLTLYLPRFMKQYGYNIPVFSYNAEVIDAHPSNISNDVAYAYAPTKEGREGLIKHGQSSELVKPLPFPINDSYKQIFKSQKEEREKLGFKDMFTILISFGGEGYGSIEIVKNILKDNLPVQILAVSGRSQETREQLDTLKRQYPDSHLNVFGFVTNMPHLLYCCDIAAGKAGMNSAFESIYMEKPYMVTMAMENELRTLDFLEKNGYGWDGRTYAKQKQIFNTIFSEGVDKIKQKIAENTIDFDAEKIGAIVYRDVEEKKKSYLAESKALYFDLAGTLCDIPISGQWEKINAEGIHNVVRYLGWNDVLGANEINALCSTFIKDKAALRKKAKETLKEYPIQEQIASFIKSTATTYPQLGEINRASKLAKEDWEEIERLFIQPELDITEPFPQARELLRVLSQSYSLYLLSNNVSRRLVLEICRKIGCEEYFTDIFVSADCAYRKPHHRFLSYVQEKTGLANADCVMIGDRLSQDIRMANKQKLKSIYAAMVDHEDNSGHEDEVYDYTIHSLDELRDIFPSPQQP